MKVKEILQNAGEISRFVLLNLKVADYLAEKISFSPFLGIVRKASSLRKGKDVIYLKQNDVTIGVRAYGCTFGGPFASEELG